MEEVTYTVKPLPRGTRIGPYTILQQVPGGIGGMAIVYEARVGNRGPSVALKVAHVGLGGFLKDETAFLRVLNLDHPNIIKILPTPLGNTSDYIVKDPETGCWYFAMEYMAGGSLEDWLQRRKHFTLAEAVDVVRQIGAALDAAHGAGIVHLDVKPSNILFYDRPEKKPRRAVLTDFGIARPCGRIASGQTLTVEYASPEQVRLAGGEHLAVGPTSDLYSLAVIFYEMLSGRLPFQAQNDLAMMHQIVYDVPPLPVPLAPLALNPIMQRALDKEPEQRYPSAEALVADLEALPREVYESSSTRHGIHPLLSLGLGILVGLSLGVPAGHYLVPSPEKTPLPIIRTVIVTVTPTPTREVVATDTPAVTSTSAAVEPTRRPTSTPVPPIPTFTPRPRPTFTPTMTPSE